MTMCSRPSTPAADPHRRAPRGAASGRALGIVALLALWAQGFAGGAALAAPASAVEPTVVMTRAQQIASGIALRPIASVAYVRSATAYGRVLDPQRLGALQKRLDAAQARRRSAAAAWTAAQRVAHRLDPSPSGDGDASTPRAAAARARLEAADTALREATRAARAQWGDALATQALQDSPGFDALASGQTFLVELVVPDGLGAAAPPATLPLHLLDGSGAPLAGRLLSPLPRLMPPAPGAGFFYTVPAGNLHPGVRVVAQIPLSRKRIRGVRIPKAAALWLGGRAWAYVQTGPERFVRRAVPTGRPVPGGWFAAKGWQAGERVVVRGAASLYAKESGAAPGHGGGAAR